MHRILVIAIAFSAQCLNGAEQGPAKKPITEDHIRKAWKSRAYTVQSMEVEALVRETHVLGIEQNDPFVAPPPRDMDDVTVEQLLTYSMANGRFAKTNVGQQWDFSQNKMTPRDFKAVFDGAENRYLSKGDHVPIGCIQTDKVPKAHDRVLINKHLIAIRLAASPGEILHADTRDMRIVSRDAVQKGHRCVEITMSRSKSTRRTRVFVDLARDFVPLGVVVENRGEAEREYWLEYAPNELLGWFVSQWTETHFNSPGEVSESIAGRVKRVSLNQPIADSTFTIEFPAGTHVIVREGGRRRPQLVLPDGTLGPLRGEDFGGRPLRAIGEAN